MNPMKTWGKEASLPRYLAPCPHPIFGVGNPPGEGASAGLKPKWEGASPKRVDLRQPECQSACP